MFKFGKKNDNVTEQFLEEVTDEQLSQVSGGSLLSTANVGGLLQTAGNVTAPVTHSIVANVSDNNLQVNPTVNVGGVNPTLVNNLLP